MRWEKVRFYPIHGQEDAKQAAGLAELSWPGKRWGHTCNAINGGRFLYLFGGYGKDNCQTNQVHIFDTVKHTWSHPLVKGIPPASRDSHSCTVVGNNLFVFGGTDGLRPLKDLHILDTSSHTWISPNTRGEGPEAREGHSAALVGKRLFIFGGCGNSADNNTEVYYNDLYILNTETYAWKCATTSGTPPSPRDSHTCTSWKNNIIVIGGEDEHDYYLSDVHILDTDTLIWRQLSTSGHLFPPRAGHSTVSFGKIMFVFGGFTDAQNLYNDLYMLDVDIGIWTKLTNTGNGPSPRFSMAGDCLDPCKGGVLVFIGGCNKNLDALDDMYYLYTGFAKESEQRPEKLSLRKKLKLKCQEQNFNFFQNQPPIRCGDGSNISQPTTVLDFSQQSRQYFPITQSLPPGKKIFQAKVIESNPGGYAIETVIDGRSLRGIVFLNKPISLYPDTCTSSRKRTAGEIGGGIFGGVGPGRLKNSKAFKQDDMDGRQADGVHGDSSASHEHCGKAVTALTSSNPTASDPSEPHKDFANPEPEAFALNRACNKEKDTQSFYGENLKIDGTNDMPSLKTEPPADSQTNMPQSNYEVRAFDLTSDEIDHNAEVQKPAAVEKTVAQSNPDSTASRTEEGGGPAKSIQD